MRLIDVDKIKDIFDENTWQGDMLKSIVENSPTAYDLEKVIEKLESKMFSAELYGNEWNGQTVNNLICLGDVVDILEGGGIDE